MGARKNHQPRRGSLAYSPRGRAKSMEARIRAWPESDSDQPRILAHCGFKAGCVRVVSIDDRDKAPNAGKQLVSLGTVLATPPALVLGIRGYSRDHDGLHAEFDVYADEIPRSIAKGIPRSIASGIGGGGGRGEGEATRDAERALGRIGEIMAILAVSPRAAGLEQKRPYIFEAMVSGGDIPGRFAHVRELLGSEIRIGQIFEAGASVDVAAITKGKGWQGVIQRWGAKKKQHKSRKTVRELGSLGPISPQSVMYTVPRAGQMGFHQRIEYDKRIMVMGSAGDGDGGDGDGGRDAKDAKDAKGGQKARKGGPGGGKSISINPPGGYKHFGLVRGDFVVLKGSVPGAYRRLVKLRSQIRNVPARINKPNILEVVV